VTVVKATNDCAFVLLITISDYQEDFLTMCGIIGFVGREQAAPILLDGLERMEYRGYDSAGIAVRSETKGLQVKKTKGRLKVLADLTHGGADLEGTLGIGHTRWATHGEPNDVNAHPHVSENGRIALVHNGIIENYMELKEHLQKLGVTFQSDTDSEVVAQLLEYHYNECHNMLEAVGRVLRRIEGSYAFGIICADYPNALIAARKDSPLILGYGRNGNFIASDVTAVIKYTRDVAYMDDGEIAVLTADSVDVFDDELVPVEKKRSTVNWDVSAAEKGGYPHFMLKEVMEQPEAIRKTISPRIKNGRVVLDEISLTEDYVREVSRIFIVACGSSYHVGMVSKYNWEKLIRRPVEVVLASEFRYCDPLVDEKTLVVIISQSGETLDTMAAMREAKRLGGRTLAIVNVVGSSIAREADDVLYTWAGPEIAVATTKAYTTQLVLMDLVGLYLADRLGTVEQKEYDVILSEMQQLPEKMQQVLCHKENIQYFASRYFNHDSIFFIGRNLDYAMGMEGSLKLKEISYIHSEAYASGELKHGTISLIEQGTLVVALGSYGPLFDKAMSNVVEVKARGAEVLALTTENFREKMEKTADATIAVPVTHPILQPSLGVVPLQLFAYYVALQRGCDIDKPRNLAKSVTVE
jgi:glucosamine--fructose-6-phosphate aminotransferase (isomerizing)